MTTNDMAGALEVARATISRWINDEGAPPRTIYIERWADICKIDRPWLLHGAATPQPGPGNLVLTGQDDVRCRGIRRHVNRIRPLTGLVAA
jgi:transcriptional regulator with XRE-family HTH domain